MGPQGYHQPNPEKERKAASTTVGGTSEIDRASDSDPELEAPVKPIELGKNNGTGVPMVVQV